MWLACRCQSKAGEAFEELQKKVLALEHHICNLESAFDKLFLHRLNLEEQRQHHGSMMAFLFGQAWASPSFCGVLWHGLLNGNLSWPEDTDSKDEPVRRDGETETRAHHISISDAHVLMTVLDCPIAGCSTVSDQMA